VCTEHPCPRAVLAKTIVVETGARRSKDAPVNQAVFTGLGTHSRIHRLYQRAVFMGYSPCGPMPVNTGGEHGLQTRVSKMTAVLDTRVVYRPFRNLTVNLEVGLRVLKSSKAKCFVFETVYMCQRREESENILQFRRECLSYCCITSVRRDGKRIRVPCRVFSIVKTRVGNGSTSYS